MKVLFNWYELHNASNKTPSGIITLTHALTKVYNGYICRNEKDLIEKLHIDYIPNAVFDREEKLYRVSNGIRTKFKIVEPQSYFLGNTWLYEEVSVEEKLIYLHALSQRHLKNRNLFIPEDYLDEIYWNNTFLKHKNGKLWFTPEMNYLTNQLKQRKENTL